MELGLGTRAGHLTFTSPVVRKNRRQVVWRLGSDLLVYAVPDCVDAVFVTESLKDTVASYHEEIKVVLEFETANFWIADDHIRIASVLLLFGLNVSESP